MECGQDSQGLGHDSYDPVTNCGGSDHYDHCGHDRFVKLGRRPAKLYHHQVPNPKLLKPSG